MSNESRAAFEAQFPQLAATLAPTNSARPCGCMRDKATCHCPCNRGRDMKLSWADKDYLAKCDEVERLESELVEATVRMDNDALTITTLRDQRDVYQVVADQMAAAHKVERDALQSTLDMMQQHESSLEDKDKVIESLSALADKWNFECDELREDNKRLSGATTRQKQPVVQSSEQHTTWPKRNANDMAPNILRLSQKVLHLEQGMTKLPPLPGHPEPHTYRWTNEEIEAIKAYGQQCRDAALTEALTIIEDTCENTRYDAVQAIKELK